MSARVIPGWVGRGCPQRAAFWQPVSRDFDAWSGALRTASPYQCVAHIECVFHEHEASQFAQEILQARPLFPPIS